MCIRDSPTQLIRWYWVCCGFVAHNRHDAALLCCCYCYAFPNRAFPRSLPCNNLRRLANIPNHGPNFLVNQNNKSNRKYNASINLQTTISRLINWGLVGQLTLWRKHCAAFQENCSSVSKCCHQEKRYPDRFSCSDQEKFRCASHYPATIEFGCSFRSRFFFQ